MAPTTQYVACWGQYFGVTCWSQLRFLRGLGGLGYRQLGLAIWGLRSLGGSRHARRFQRCVALTEGINQLDGAPYPACLGGRASGRAVGSKNTACSMRSGLFLEGIKADGWDKPDVRLADSAMMHEYYLHYRKRLCSAIIEDGGWLRGRVHAHLLPFWDIVFVGGGMTRRDWDAHRTCRGTGTWNIVERHSTTLDMEAPRVAHLTTAL